MGTQLILTVGTNPLPIWVAWYHLKDKLCQPIKVRLVHTAGTEAEKGRLQNYCQGADFLDPIQTSDGDPRTVHNDMRNIANNLSDETTLLHIHYIGGTKVMAVETVAAFEATLLNNIHLDTSYLDPRATSGPAIVNRAGNTWVQDARKNIAADLARIALLNGFTLGPFRHRYWNRETNRPETEDCPAPGIPSQEQLDEGRQAITGGDYITDYTLLEYGAYAAFKEALENISTNNLSRNNYKLFHNVYVRRTGASQSAKPFELDVVAVLGYQIVVVSCTLEGSHDRIKQKGMEAILRARQLGGDEARAIVLCSVRQNDAALIEDELKDEMGSASEPLQVWGRNRWRGLSEVFEHYLRNDLHWK